MTCNEALELLSAALDGELSPSERNTLDAHLADCDSCAALFDELAGQSRLLRELDCEVPAGLSASILASLPEQAPAKGQKALHWRRWGTLAACLVLVAWAGFALPGQSGNKAHDMPMTADMAAEAQAECSLTSAESAPFPDAIPSSAAEQQKLASDTAPAEAPSLSPMPTASAGESAERAKSKAESLPIYGTRVFRVTWSGELSQPEGTVITTPEELSALLARYSVDDLTEAAYDQNWFDSAALVAVTLSEGSGSVSHEAEAILLAEEGCQVVIRRTVPEAGTCDMAGWVILIETDRSILTQNGLTVVLEP